MLQAKFQCALGRLVDVSHICILTYIVTLFIYECIKGSVVNVAKSIEFFFFLQLLVW